MIPREPTVGVVIPTLDGACHLRRTLPLLCGSPFPLEIVIGAREEDEETRALAQLYKTHFVVNNPKTFNHGSSREKMRRLVKAPIVVLLSQDAYPKDAESLSKLVHPLMEGNASLAYGRQVADPQASIIEILSREFNYPKESHLRSLKDAPLYGSYLPFFSNAAAAYRMSALDEIGGFPHILFAEDTLAAARLLRKHHTIAYVAEAIFFHSHDDSLTQLFHRYFDIGYTRKLYEKELHFGEGLHPRGKHYVQFLLQELVNRQSVRRIPQALIQCFVKYAAYTVGRLSHQLLT